MLGIKILQKIFIYTIIALGTIVLLSIIGASAFVYFKNDFIVSSLRTLNNDFQTLIENVSNNVNQAMNQITSLVGTNGTEGQIQNSISSIITELQNLQQTNPGLNLSAQISQLQGFKDNLTTGELSNLVTNIQSATQSALMQINNINTSFVTPVVGWVVDNSKVISLIVFVSSSVILIMSVALTIFIKIFGRKNKKDKPKKDK